MKFVEFRNRGRRQRGAALVMIVFAVVGLAALSAGLMYVGLGRAKEQRGEQEKIHAEYVCQAGLSQAMYQLQRGMSGNVATQNNPSAWGTSEFWVQENHVTPTVIRLT